MYPTAPLAVLTVVEPAKASAWGSRPAARTLPVDGMKASIWVRVAPPGDLPAGHIDCAAQQEGRCTVERLRQVTDDDGPVGGRVDHLDVAGGLGR